LLRLYCSDAAQSDSSLESTRILILKPGIVDLLAKQAPSRRLAEEWENMSFHRPVVSVDRNGSRLMSGAGIRYTYNQGVSAGSQVDHCREKRTRRST
jgi:hypothetical protein